MPAVLSTVTKIKFDDDGMFSALHLQEWVPGYNKVSMDDLLIADFCDDTTFLISFLASCTKEGTYDESDILSVKASSEGILERIYGPVILVSETGDLILRCGSNIFPLVQKEEKFILGELKGDFESYDLKIKKDTPDERTISIPRIDFKNPNDKSIIYSIRVLTLEGVDGEALKQIARDGQAINSYLMVAKSGGVNAFKITEILEGEYKVVGIDCNEGGKYGNSYLIILGEKAVWANKSLRSILDRNYSAFKKFLAQGKDVTLKVANIRELDSGNKSCDAALFLRSPKAIAPAKSTPELPSVPVTVAPIVKPESEAIDVTATTTEEVDPNRPIPF